MLLVVKCAHKVRVVLMNKPLYLSTLSLLGMLLFSTTLSAASLQAELVDSEGQPLANAVLSGTAVSFPNSDNIRHHVYSFSLAKRFELRLYQGTPSEPVVFDKPGVVVLGCNIHDWMVGYVYVTDDPWFAVSDAQGKLNLEQLPAGTYTASLWHPQAPDMLPQDAGQVQLTEAGSLQRFTLSMQAPGGQTAPSAPVSAFGDAFKKARDAAQ